MHNLRVGDEVRISGKGRERYKNAPSNPHHDVGTLIGNDGGTAFSLYVKWSNGEQNSYCVGELELVNVIVENE